MSKQIEITKKIIDYLSLHSHKDDHLINELINETAQLGKVSKMQIAPEQGKFLEILVRLIKAKNCLEIGRFTGLSTLCIAKGLPNDGKVISIDNSNEFLDIAEKYWKKAEVYNKIQSIFGEALEVLQSFIDRQKFFDCIFIDADKNNYNNYYELSLNLIPTNGLIIIDNMLWGGDVADSNIHDKTTASIRDLNKKMLKDSRIEFSLLPMADGLLLIQKK
tara:strand:+ start:1113 stop:1769 length:657 start_codon:yes stop_codon:yes gene_type:complete